MNRIVSLFAAAFICAVVFAIASLQTHAEDAFAGVGSGATTLSYYIPSANYAGSPYITFVSATSDKAASVLKFYKVSATVPVTATSAAAQTTVSAIPVGITNNDVVIVRSRANDTYQRCVVSSATSTNFVVSANLSFALASGDLVYKMTANGTVPVGAATLTLNGAGTGVYFGPKGTPTLVEVDGTSACSINLIAGRYLR